MIGTPRAVHLPKGVAARDERHGLFVVHGHAGKGLADVACGRNRIGVPVWAFRVDVNQTHLHRSQRVTEFTVAGVSLVGKPRSFGPPVDVLFGFPYIGTSAAKSERGKAHRFEGDIAGQDHQIRPRQ